MSTVMTPIQARRQAALLTALIKLLDELGHEWTLKQREEIEAAYRCLKVAPPFTFHSAGAPMAKEGRAPSLLERIRGATQKR